LSGGEYPRNLAVRIITKVLNERQPLDRILDELAYQYKVEAGTRQWLQEVCSGTLRWKGRLELALDSVALKKKPSGWLRKILLLAIYQLIAQERTNPATVVSETVTEIRRKEGDAPAKFANASLRNVSHHVESWKKLKPPETADEKVLAQWGSLPLWLWKQFKNDYGFDWTARYAVLSLERPRLWVRAKNDHWKLDWLDRPGPEYGQVPATALQLNQVLKVPGSVSSWEGYREGLFIIQDISSQFLVEQVSQVVKGSLVKETLRALDVCAAPGGKSVGLAWNGFEVTASDRYEEKDERQTRLSLLKQTVARAAPDIKVLEPQNIGETFDLVWVDAPCSGTGILRRHPDVRWIRTEDEVRSLTELQSKLVHESWSRVGENGFLVYSICSLLKDEGSRLFEKILPSIPSASVVKSWSLSPLDVPFGDGFWAILLKKHSR